MQKRDAKGRFVSDRITGDGQKVYERGFKGFFPGLICRGQQYGKQYGKQYAENTVFQERKAVLCEKGMHFCKYPLDVFHYYLPCNHNGTLSEFAEVEALAPCETEINKSCTTKLRVNAKLSLAELCRAAVKFVQSKIVKDKKQHVVASGLASPVGSAATNTLERSEATNNGPYSVATNVGYFSASISSGYGSAATNTGHYSAAINTGDSSVATSTGDNSVAENSGDYSVAINTGNYSAAINAGYCSVAINTGKYSASVNDGVRSAAINTGDCSAATNTGACSVATNNGRRSVAISTGDSSTAISTGDSSASIVEGKGSFAIATGRGSRVKGAIGCFLACVEWERRDDGVCYPVRFISAKVDGEKIKADTWYEVKNGEFV